MILYTGSTGTIGSRMGEGPRPLVTRLERPAAEMAAEIRSLGGEGAPLIHLAAMVGIERCEREPDHARELNVGGSLRWFEAAGVTGSRQFVYVSTAHVFAAPAIGERSTPLSPTRPRSVYASTKLEAEGALRELEARFPRTRLAIARVFGVLSDAMPRGTLLARLNEQARNRDLAPIPGLSFVRDFLDAGEVCRQLLRLAACDDPPPIVLVCSGRETRVRQLAEQVFRAHGIDPAPLTEAPGRPDDVPYLVGVPTPF